MKIKILLTSLCIFFCFACKKENDSMYKITAKTFFSPFSPFHETAINISANNDQLKNIFESIEITQSDNKDLFSLSLENTGQENFRINATSDSVSTFLKIKFKNERNQEVRLDIPKKETLENFTIKY